MISIWHGSGYDWSYRVGCPILLRVAGQSCHRQLVFGGTHLSMCLGRNAYVYSFFVVGTFWSYVMYSIFHWYFDCSRDGPRVHRIHQIQIYCDHLVRIPPHLHQWASRVLLIPPTRLVSSAVADVAITFALTFHLVKLHLLNLCEFLS